MGMQAMNQRFWPPVLPFFSEYQERHFISFELKYSMIEFDYHGSKNQSMVSRLETWAGVLGRARFV